MIPDHLSRFTKPIPVLGGQGHVALIDVMGDDARVADAARTSYQGDAALRETRNTTADAALIRRLLRDRHTSPFEHAHLTIHVRCPMDVWRQWVRHRTANVSEYSTRYKQAIDDALTTAPDAWRAQAKDNKQESSGFVTEWPEGWTVQPFQVKNPDGTLSERFHVRDQTGEIVCSDQSPGERLSCLESYVQDHTRQAYEERLRFGVAREQARKDLPLSTMTEAVWTCDLHNLLHFLSLRMDPHAQQEIREYANVIAKIVEAWCPATWSAFVDWRLEAITLSGPEIRALRTLLGEIDGGGESTQTIATVGLRGALYKGEIPPSELPSFLRKLGLE